MPRKASFTTGERPERTGRWVRQGTGDAEYRAFVPNPLPPDPPIELDRALERRLEAASLAVGRLDGGEFRRSQNWIGGSRPGDAFFVPPPVGDLGPALDNLEKFFHQSEQPTLLKTGLAHAQFETIHPFLDGNGRVGRMLITLLLVADGVLAKPWLYMSLHFKRHRQLYYEKLQRVRTHGDWEGWLAFYLDGVQTVAERATETLEALLRLFREDREKVQAPRGDSVYQRSATLSNVTVFEHLRERLMLNIPETAAACGLSKPTVKRVLDDLTALGIVQETTGGARNRVYLYKRYFEILNRDTLDTAQANASDS